MEDNTDISTSGPVSAQDFRFSQQFTEYTELPSNGYSRLFKAQRYGVWHVLKGVKPQYTNDPQYVAMLDKEFALTMELSHPNIVRVIGREQDPVACDCIVMEYVDGRTLADFLKEKPSLMVRRQVTQELLEAMSYFHRKQVVHQDLKPSNILITHDGNHVKIIDFGFADSRMFAILKESAYTYSYAAPEQLNGGEVDNRTDLYSFGLILKLLFPSRYGHIVRKCLHPQKEKRFPSAEAVLHEISKADRIRKWLPFAAVGAVALMGLAILLTHSFPQRINDSGDSEESELPMGDTSRLAGALDGLFSVAPSKQVRFSRGNLQYNTIGKHRTADGGTASGTWRFAKNQYDIIGTDNANASATYTGWIDLFGWGTSGWNSGAACYQPWSSSVANNDYYPGADSEKSLTGAFAFADWGVYNAIHNGGNTPNRWRVLTNDENKYLCLTRKASTVNGVADARYAKAMVNGINGLILFPDEYNPPQSVRAPVNININEAPFSENSYSSKEWLLLEAAGAVFLPSAGVRFGQHVDDIYHGYYYSSTAANASGAYSLGIRGSDITLDWGGWRLYGISVRLVQDAD